MESTQEISKEKKMSFTWVETPSWLYPPLHDFQMLHEFEDFTDEPK